MHGYSDDAQGGREGLEFLGAGMVWGFMGHQRGFVKKNKKARNRR